MNPHGILLPLGPQPSASANSAILAVLKKLISRIALKENKINRFLKTLITIIFKCLLFCKLYTIIYITIYSIAFTGITLYI